MGGRIRTPEPFAYPATPHIRKHGPHGYMNYESYRDWLRDEFSFRCVFCLRREQWGVVGSMWDIDHFAPQYNNPQRKLDYENLLYTCRTCNSAKGSQIVPDPCNTAFGECIEVQEDGTVSALSANGEKLIDRLRLDNEDHTRFRYLMINTLRSLARHNRKIYILWMRYPDALPDLSKLRPCGNTKPEGINDSCYARRVRGELPETY